MAFMSPLSFLSWGIIPSPALMRNLIAARADKIIQAFLTDYAEAELTSACKAAYADNFDSPLTAPVRFLGDGTAVLELWHGPTQAFKDMALQLMPRLLTTAIQSDGGPL